MTPRTPTERWHKRRTRLNAMARSYGFDSWTKLETAMLDGRAAVLLPGYTAAPLTGLSAAAIQKKSRAATNRAR